MQRQQQIESGAAQSTSTAQVEEERDREERKIELSYIANRQ